MNYRSLAFRLAVWYALLLSATFALIGTGMFYGLEQYLRSNLRDSLRRRHQFAAALEALRSGAGC